ncbi:uncharacterized protein [Miscanthus floridulus]|uniref:uncharacterized protein n=1 Tax=Miscanthus floridulus TaxID=154761 RepID=UPI00345856BD
MDMTPTSRLSHSMLSASSSRVKSTDVGSSRFVHQSRGLPYVGKSSPINIRARDDSPSTPNAAKPSHHDVLARMPSLVMEGVSGTGTDLSPTTTTSGDPSATSPSVQPTSGTVAWAVGGASCATTLGAAMVASGCGLPVTAAATSTCVSEALISCVAPTVDGTTSAEGSSVCPSSTSVSPPSSATQRPPKASLEPLHPLVPSRAWAPPWAVPDRSVMQPHRCCSRPKWLRCQPTVAAPLEGRCSSLVPTPKDYAASRRYKE